MKSDLKKEIKEKIIEILENRIYGWREGIFTPRFFELSAELILELFEQEKQKWVEEMKRKTEEIEERDYSAEGEAEAEARGKHEEAMKAQDEEEAQRQYENNQPPPGEPPF